MYWDHVKQGRFAVVMNGTASLNLRGNLFGKLYPVCLHLCDGTHVYVARFCLRMY